LSARAERLIIVLIGMAALAVLFAFAPVLIAAMAWVFFWPYFLGNPPDPTAEAWLKWTSVGIPAVIYLLILAFVVAWLRKAPPE
jgi:hypothetical protein